MSSTKNGKFPKPIYRDARISRMSEEEHFRRISNTTPEEVAEVRNDIYKILDLVIKNQELSIPHSSYPKVFIGRENGSYYDHSKNVIVIGKDLVGFGPVYAGEAGHFLGAFAQGEIGDSPELILGSKESRIHEFCDRVTANLTKKLVSANKEGDANNLKHLFDSRDLRYLDYSTPAGLNFFRGLFKDAIKDRKKAEESSESSEKSAYLDTANDTKNHARAHLSYILADRLTSEELENLKGFYNLSNEEVWEKYFKPAKRKANLEKMTGSFAFISLLSGIFFLSPVFTGNVIGINEKSSFQGGLGLIFLGFLFGFFWIKNKKK